MVKLDLVSIGGRYLLEGKQLMGLVQQVAEEDILFTPVNAQGHFDVNVVVIFSDSFCSINDPTFSPSGQ